MLGEQKLASDTGRCKKPFFSTLGISRLHRLLGTFGNVEKQKCK